MVEAQSQETNLSSVINDLNARIRILESKYNLFGERLLIINRNTIDEYKKITQELKVLDKEIKEIKKDIYNIKEILSHITHDMETFAKKENLRVLEKYINLWNPLNFITEKEVREIVQKEVENYAKGTTNRKSSIDEKKDDVRRGRKE